METFLIWVILLYYKGVFLRRVSKKLFMEDKIIALLTTQFPGVRNDGLKQLARVLSLQFATEDEAKALVEKLTKAQVDGFVKEFRKEVDREVSDSNKTFETNLKKQYDLVEKKKAEKTEKEKPEEKPDDVTTALLLAELKKITLEISGMKTERVAGLRLQSLKDKLEGCKSDDFKAKVLKDFARMQFETDEEFNEYLTETEQDITKANQGVADLALGKQRQPWKSAGSSSDKKATDKEIEQVLKQLPIEV